MIHLPQIQEETKGYHLWLMSELGIVIYKVEALNPNAERTQYDLKLYIEKSQLEAETFRNDLADLRSTALTKEGITQKAKEALRGLIEVYVELI